MASERPNIPRSALDWTWLRVCEVKLFQISIVALVWDSARTVEERL